MEMIYDHSFYLVLVRWVHFLAGVTWIGLLYYFNIVQVPFMKETDPATKSAVVQKLVPRALWWFRYGALVTVLAGILLLQGHWQGFGNLFSSSWGIFISIGGLLGLIMFFNVWVFIWPNQKQIIRMTTEAAANKTAPPPEMAKLARIAYLASRTNFVLSFPMLFCMGAASHWSF
ncbi:MAG TPA: urate hydroxylase PuuD [Nitrospiria bacterium]|jgi:uncharacterized membrane protein|nr:urate hydroxylase PuuD [Nitrospiria bacterium]